MRCHQKMKAISALVIAIWACLIIEREYNYNNIFMVNALLIRGVFGFHAGEIADGGESGPNDVCKLGQAP
jgi:hypothetical protein